MKKLTALILCACVCAGLVLARSSKARSAGLSDADTVRQLELDWAEATKAIDVNRISQILADGWRGVGRSGNIRSKEWALNYLRTREIRLESFEFGPMDVRVLGNVAMVKGSITQHFINIKDGQHENYKSAWLDVYEKRGDRWVVTRSQITPLSL
jgi:ketosteroid isomerase-like protein